MRFRRAQARYFASSQKSRGWLESRALELGKTIPRGNAERIFGV